VKITGLYPRVRVDTSPTAAIGQAGGVLLTRTVTATGLDRFLSSALAGWRKPLAIHDPGKIITDLALSLALGGDCLADLGLLRTEPGVYGRVASDPTVSRAITALAAEAPAALAAIDSARAGARQRAWQLAGQHAPLTMAPTRSVHWSSTWTRPWSPHIRRRRTPRRRSNAASGSTRCAGSATTGLTGPGNPWPSCCGPVTPAPTPLPTTSP